MAKKTINQNRRSRLDEQMAALAHSMVLVNQTMAALNQSTAEMHQSTAALNRTRASFLERLAETDKELANLKRQSDEKYAGILHVLAEHSRILERLPDAVREKISFKPQ